MDWSLLPTFSLGTVLWAFAGALVLHLWQRYLGRMATIRWSEIHNQVASSGHDPNIGHLQVLWNDKPVENIQLCTVEVENESSRDLKDVEVKFCYEDGTKFLDRGTTYGTTQFFPFGTHFNAALQRITATSPEQQANDYDLQYVHSRREFVVPVMNRGTKLRFMFFVRTLTLHPPKLAVAIEHSGVKLRQQPQRPILLGVPQTHAIWTGLVLGLAIAVWLGPLISVPVMAAIFAFIIGCLFAALGAVAIRLFRFALKRIG